MVEQLFRGINNPNNIRKDVLESSKEIIQNLKGYQKILEIRQRKSEKIRALRVQLKEINMFIDKLKDNFSADLLIQFKKEHKEEKKPGSKKKGKQEKKIVAEASEITQLENKLADIENKLKTLS